MFKLRQFLSTISRKLIWSNVLFYKGILRFRQLRESQCIEKNMLTANEER